MRLPTAGEVIAIRYYNGQVFMQVANRKTINDKTGIMPNELSRRFGKNKEQCQLTPITRGFCARIEQAFQLGDGWFDIDRRELSTSKINALIIQLKTGKASTVTDSLVVSGLDARLNPFKDKKEYTLDNLPRPQTAQPTNSVEVMPEPYVIQVVDRANMVDGHKRSLPVGAYLLIEQRTPRDDEYIVVQIKEGEGEPIIIGILQIKSPTMSVVAPLNSSLPIYELMASSIIYGVVADGVYPLSLQ